MSEDLHTAAFAASRANLVAAGRGRAALVAAGRGDTERVLEILDGGADVNAADADGITLVSSAARRGHTETVRALAARGADVDAVDVRGATPVFGAAAHGHMETVRALVECGARVGTANNRGETPLFIAAANGRTACVLALAREYGLDARAVNVEGMTPVFIAAWGGHTETVRALVHQCGADANTRNIEGLTPVVVAAYSGHTACVRALVRECGADLTIANSAGMTPVYAAVIGGHLETVQALVREFGADVNTPSSAGFTPLDAAATHRGDAAAAWTLVREGGAHLDRALEQRKAFAMALHRRLGRGSQAYALDEHLLQMVLGPHVASRPLSAKAAERGHRKAASVLKFLEEQEDVEPEDAEKYAAANAEWRADFECPVCFESAGEALALAPCGHPVCSACWARIRQGDKKCPLCRSEDVVGVGPETFPRSAPLRERFRVQLGDLGAQA